MSDIPYSAVRRFVAVNSTQLVSRWILVLLFCTGGGLNELKGADVWTANLIWAVVLVPGTVFVNCWLWSAVTRVTLQRSWAVPPHDPIHLHEIYRAPAYHLAFFLLAVLTNIAILRTESLLLIPIGIAFRPISVAGGIITALMSTSCNWIFPLWKPATTSVE